MNLGPATGSRALSGAPWARAPWVVAGVVAGAACVATVAFAVSTLAFRPLDGSEGNFLFEAARIRDSLALYVDPLIGATDYGPVPSRYYVLYTPLWAVLLAALPASLAPALARALSLASWLGLLAWLGASAPRSRRPIVLAGAAFVAGLYPLMLFAASGRPDAIALVLAGVALFRSARAGRVGALEGALFALAPFFKPNIVWAGLGALAADLVARRAKAWPAIASAAFMGVACSGALEVATGGAWLPHLLASAWMPFSARLWEEQMASRLPFFALPLAFSAWCAARARAYLSLSALGASVAATLLLLAKIGSASNYWMEPCIAALVVVATVPGPPVLAPRTKVAAGVLVAAQVLWTGTAAVRSSFEAIAASRAKRQVLDGARAQCKARPDDVVVADEAGIELMLDGRIIEQPLIFTQLVRRGLYPLATWMSDVSRPEVRCLVLQTDWLEREDEVPEHALFPAALRPTLRAKFRLAGAHAGIWVYQER